MLNGSVAESYVVVKVFMKPGASLETKVTGGSEKAGCHP